MEIIRNQTLYKCFFCGQRKLTKRGCLLHENKYCSSALSPHKINAEKERKEKQENCSHAHKETQYRYIPGEAVQEPDYDECVDCGKVL